MTPEELELKKALDLQAYVDGEMSAGERARVEALLSGDPKAQGLVRSLSGIRELMKAGEPEVRIAESREFYWTAIERGIRKEMAEAPKAEPWSLAAWIRDRGWLRLALPAAGVAALAVLIMTVGPARLRSATVAALSLNHEVESESEDAVAFTFRSEHSGMSVVWVQGRHDF